MNPWPSDSFLRWTQEDEPNNRDCSLCCCWFGDTSCGKRASIWGDPPGSAGQGSAWTVALVVRPSSGLIASHWWIWIRKDHFYSELFLPLQHSATGNQCFYSTNDSFSIQMQSASRHWNDEKNRRLCATADRLISMAKRFATLTWKNQSASQSTTSFSKINHRAIDKIMSLFICFP